MVDDLLFDLVRHDFSTEAAESGALRDPRIASEVLRSAQRYRILPLAYHRVAEALVQKDALPFEQVCRQNTDRTQAQLSLLKEIAHASQTEKLRTVFIKGIVLSDFLYGRSDIRQCGDLDLLVDSRDLHRCDHILKALGHFQPFWNLGSARESRMLSIIVGAKSKQSAPYLYRRKTHDCQLAPYYSAEGSTKVEVHDGLRLLPDDCTKEMLWDTTWCLCESVRYRTLNPEPAFVLLLANTYQNSETFYALKDDELNLRDYCDIQAFIKNHSHKTDWRRVRSYVHRHHLEYMVAPIYRNYCDLFGDCRDDMWDAIVPGITKTAAKGDYVERLRNTEYRHDKADRWLRGLCLQADELVGKPIPIENTIKLDVRFLVEVLDSGIKASWIMPSRVSGELSLFYFQVGLVPCCSGTDYLEHISCVSVAEGEETEAGYGFSHRMAQNPIRKKTRGTLESHVRSEGEKVAVTLFIPKDTLRISQIDGHIKIGVFPAIYLMNSASTYTSIRKSEDEFLRPVTSLSLTL